MNQSHISGSQGARRIAFTTIGGASEVGFWSSTPFRTPKSPQDGLTSIRYLDKNAPAKRNRIEQLYREADFFLLPTRADCFLCEAGRRVSDLIQAL